VHPTRRNSHDEWTGVLTPHLSDWRSSLPPLRGRDALMMVLAPSALTAVCMLLFALLAEALVVLASWLRQLDYGAFSYWAYPPLWVLLLGAPALVGGLVARSLCSPTINAFSFDRSRRTLRYTEVRFWGAAQTTAVQFESIASVRACLPKTGDETGSFEVRLDRGGRFRSLLLGSHIPLATLRQHLAWLAEDLNEHVVSTLQWDT
jgi:hypothetical protein